MSVPSFPPQFAYPHCAHIIPVSAYSKVTHKPFKDTFSLFLHLSRHKHMPQFEIFTGSALDAQTIQDSISHPRNTLNLEINSGNIIIKKFDLTT